MLLLYIIYIYIIDYSDLDCIRFKTKIKKRYEKNKIENCNFYSNQL